MDGAVPQLLHVFMSFRMTSPSTLIHIHSLQFHFNFSTQFAFFCNVFTLKEVTTFSFTNKYSLGSFIPFRLSYKSYLKNIIILLVLIFLCLGALLPLILLK
jgi:hypothetical protein